MDHLCQYLSLPLGSAEIRTDITVSAIRQCLRSVQVYHTAGSIFKIVGTFRSSQQNVVFHQIAVDIFHFLAGQLKIHTAHCIHQIGKCFKVHQYIAADMNIEILLNSLHQQFCATIGICRIQTIPLMSRNVHIHITEQGCHVDLLRLVADGQQDHGI